MDDKKHRSYVDYLDYELGTDLFVKPNKVANNIELYTLNKRTEKKEIVKVYRKGFKPKEVDFTNLIDFIKDEISEFRTTFIMYGLVALLFVIMIAMGNKNSASEQNVKQAAKELIHNNNKGLDKSITNVTKVLVKK